MKFNCDNQARILMINDFSLFLTQTVFIIWIKKTWKKTEKNTWVVWTSFIMFVWCCFASFGAWQHLVPIHFHCMEKSNLDILLTEFSTENRRSYMSGTTWNNICLQNFLFIFWLNYHFKCPFTLNGGWVEGWLHTRYDPLSGRMKTIKKPFCCWCVFTDMAIKMTQWHVRVRHPPITCTHTNPLHSVCAGQEG